VPRGPDGTSEASDHKEREMSTRPKVHRYTSSPELAFVNAYLVESDEGVVAVDGTLTVSDGRALRAQVAEFGKPLLAVLVTHAHPDHYGGIIELVGPDEIPIIATRGVDEIIRRDDAVKETILRPMFADEWPERRAFPTRTVTDGERIELGDAVFEVVDLGPGESPHDSVWLLGEDRRFVFAGDQAYNHVHCYLADGFYESWLAHIERLRQELPAKAVLNLGHGAPADLSLFDWQVGYIETFVSAIDRADWSTPDRAKAEVVRAMKGYLPADQLQFLMELSIEPMSLRLGAVPG
jgi:glyoxylase-like metal-dependent hydrolase (beta-lactamase superfamily II)